ncbi:MAG: pyruvate kinase [bacterium]
MRLKDKKTKIIATISDLKCDIEFLRELYENGMNAVRLNTAHQTPEATLKIIENIRKVSDRIALIVDTKGPEIRTSKVQETIIVKKGDTIKVAGGAKEYISTRDLIYVDYKNFSKEIPKNTSFLIDDGELEMKAIKKRGDFLVCKVMNDGAIKSYKSINVPDAHINLPSLTPKDKNYILFAIKNEIDFISHSFVRNKEDVLAIQKILDKYKSPIKILAKIENQEGVDNIDEILECVYGIIIARGDLAVEIPAEDVPIIQKRIIKKCVACQKPVITATQILHSMIKNPRPTRAEVSDIANAILDGTDALWLSGETAYGDYPIEAVKVMAKTAKKAEAEKIISKDIEVHSDNPIVDYLAKAAVHATEELPIKEIIISSHSAFSAEVIASYRGKAKIFVKCFDKRRVRELALTYGVNAHYLDVKKIKKPLINHILETSVKREKLSKEDLIIFLSNEDKEKLITNSMEICEVGKYL